MNVEFAQCETATPRLLEENTRKDYFNFIFLYIKVTINTDKASFDLCLVFEI